MTSSSTEAAIQGARDAVQRGLTVYQCWLRIWDEQGTRPTGPDDPSEVLSAIQSFGWGLVTTNLVQYPGSITLDCMYVFRRAR